MSEDEHSEGVVVRRVIRARPERVFRSWTDPAELRRWWGPDGFTCPEATVDLRTGGTYRLVMQPPGDGPLMSVTGTYQRIDPPSLLVYTWRWDSGPAASGRRVDADIEITEMIPDQRIEFRTVKGPVREADEPAAH